MKRLKAYVKSGSNLNEPLVAPPKRQFAKFGGMAVGALIFAFAIFLALAPPSDEQATTDLETEAVRQAYASSANRGDDWLQPAIRFDEYKPGEEHYEAQQLLNEGDILTANKRFGSRNSVEHPDGPREQRMMVAVQKAWDEQLGIKRDEEFAFRVREYWLAELESIIDRPVTAASISKTIGQLEEGRRRLDDVAEVQFEGAEGEALRMYVERLRAAQSSTFPRMRRAMGSLLANRLFRENIEVELSGSRDDRLTLTSHQYASNANIADHFLAMNEQIERLRFKKVTFRTGADGNGLTYNLETPADDSLRWN